MTYLESQKRNLGTLMIVFAILKIVVYIIGLQFLSMGLEFIDDDPEVLLVAHMLKYMIGVAVALLSIPTIIAGIGLRQQKDWALLLALIIGILALPVFPFGTGIGIYAIIVFLMDKSPAYSSKQTSDSEPESENMTNQASPTD